MESTETWNTSEAYLRGQLLLATPTMADPRFAHSVIYICEHGTAGAFGLIINRLIDTISFTSLLKGIGFEREIIEPAATRSLRYGGPVDVARGFILHSDDYVCEASSFAGEGMAMTATTDILRDIAEGQGPSRHIIAFGYTGWGAGQLDGELRTNSWLSVASDPNLVFDDDVDSIWDRALAKLGVSAEMLSLQAGRA